MSELFKRHGDSEMHHTWTGKDRFVNGVWCIKDMGTPEFNALKTQSQTVHPWNTYNGYANNLIYFIAVIVFVFILKRVAFYMADANSKVSRCKTIFWKRILYQYAAFARYFTYRRLPKFVCELFQLPTSFGNFLLIMVGCIYVLGYTFAAKPFYRDCSTFGSPPLGTKTGLMSTILVPIILILSGKSNIISQLTGISYEKINVYHRWVSVACCFLGWVHTIAFYYAPYKDGGSARVAAVVSSDIFYINGIPPIVFLTVLTVFSHSYIRALWYELWLDIHWICALGFYISLFIHTGNALDSWKYLAAAVVFWFSQMLWRGLAKNFFKMNKGGFLRACPSTMRRLASIGEDHYFEIVIENTSELTWAPGQHVFLRIPGLRFLENHPFSIMSHYEPFEDNKLRFIVKTGGWKGLTSMIYESLPDQGFKEQNIFVDGPYGGAERQIDSFNSIFLMASGTGITAVIPFMMEFIEKCENKHTLLQKLRLDWVIRESENIEWIKPELQKAISKAAHLIKNGSIKINIYIAKEIGVSETKTLDDLLGTGVATMESSESEEEKETATPLLLSNFISLQNAKPDFANIVRNNISRQLGNKNMFVVSGSDSMRSSVSDSVASIQQRVFQSAHIDEIYLHSETFGW